MAGFIGLPTVSRLRLPKEVGIMDQGQEKLGIHFSIIDSWILISTF
jgi:hypothetical protein